MPAAKELSRLLGRNHIATTYLFYGYIGKGIHARPAQEEEIVLRPLILGWLLEGPCHGHELLQRLVPSEPGSAGLNEGRLYKLLGDLEREGLTRHLLVRQKGLPDRKVLRLTLERIGKAQPRLSRGRSATDPGRGNGGASTVSGPRGRKGRLMRDFVCAGRPAGAIPCARLGGPGAGAGGLLGDNRFQLGAVDLNHQNADVLSLGDDRNSDLDLVHLAAVVELGRPLPGLPGGEWDVELG